MDDQSTYVAYIEIPQSEHRPIRIDVLLEKRMREFVLARRQKIWQEQGR